MLKLICGSRKFRPRLNCANGTCTIFEHWEAFQQRYRAELVQQAKTLQQIRKIVQQEQVTLITAAKSKDYNHVIVLKRLLEQG